MGGRAEYQPPPLYFLAGDTEEASDFLVCSLLISKVEETSPGPQVSNLPSHVVVTKYSCQSYRPKLESHLLGFSAGTLDKVLD